MEMHQIRYFLAASGTLNFTRAAEQCHVSQPALTNAIKKLEGELGAPLFHRDGKRVLLSEFGQTMRPHLDQILQRTDVARTAAENFRLLNKVPVRLGVLPTIGPVRFARALAAFQASYPGVEVAVREGKLDELVPLLEEGELDLAVLSSPEPLPEFLRARPLYVERYVVVFSPENRLGELDAVRLKDLSGEPYVDRLACEMREMVMAVCEERGVELYAKFRSQREDWVQGMVLANLGFAFLPEYSVTLTGMISRRLIEPHVERTVSLVSVSGRRHSPATAAMVQAIQSHKWPG